MTLSSSVDPADIQIRIAINHLLGMRRSLKDAYNDLLGTLSSLQSQMKIPLDGLPPQCGDQRFYLNRDDFWLLKKVFRVASIISMMFVLQMIPLLNKFRQQDFPQ
jgi:hypothetical protein